MDKIGIHNPLAFEALKDHVGHQISLHAGMAFDKKSVVREVVEIRCQDCDVTLIGIGDDPVGLAVGGNNVALFCDDEKAQQIKAAYT